MTLRIIVPALVLAATIKAFGQSHEFSLQLESGENFTLPLAEIQRIEFSGIISLDPPVLEISLLNTAELQLQWEAIPGAQDYEVYQQATLGGESSLLLTTSETSGALPVVVDDSSLYFVRAIN